MKDNPSKELSELVNRLNRQFADMDAMGIGSDTPLLMKAYLLGLSHHAEIASHTAMKAYKRLR